MLSTLSPARHLRPQSSRAATGRSEAPRAGFEPAAYSLGERGGGGTEGQARVRAARESLQAPPFRRVHRGLGCTAVGRACVPVSYPGDGVLTLLPCARRPEGYRASPFAGRRRRREMDRWIVTSLSTPRGARASSAPRIPITSASTSMAPIARTFPAVAASPLVPARTPSMSKIASACPGVQSRRSAEQNAIAPASAWPSGEAPCREQWPMTCAASTRPRTVSSSRSPPRIACVSPRAASTLCKRGPNDEGSAVRLSASGTGLCKTVTIGARLGSESDDLAQNFAKHTVPIRVRSGFPLGRFRANDP